MSLTKLKLYVGWYEGPKSHFFSGSSGHFETVDATGRVVGGCEFHPHYVVCRVSSRCKCMIFSAAALLTRALFFAQKALESPPGAEL